MKNRRFEAWNIQVVSIILKVSVFEGTNECVRVESLLLHLFLRNVISLPSVARLKNLARVAGIELYSKRFKSYRHELVYRVSVSSTSHSPPFPLPLWRPTTCHGLSRAFLRVAAPRVSSKAAADNNWQPTGQRASRVLPAKTAFLSFLAGDSSFDHVPRKCSKYGLFSDRWNVTYLTLPKGKRNMDTITWWTRKGNE